MRRLSLLAWSCLMLFAGLGGCTPSQDPSQQEPIESSGLARATGPVVSPLTVMTLNARKAAYAGHEEYDQLARVPRIAAMISTQYPAVHIVAISDLATGAALQIRDELATRATSTTWDFREVHAGVEYLAVFWRTSRIELLAKNDLIVTAEQRQTTQMPGVPSPLLHQDEGLCGPNCDDCTTVVSGIQVLRLRDKLQDKPFYLYNTHFPANTDCERVGMAAIAGWFVGQRSYPAYPFLFMGDMNARKEANGTVLDASYTALVNALAANNAFFDTHPEVDPKNKTFNHYNDDAKKVRVGSMYDHILYQPAGFHAVSSYVDRTLFMEQDIPVDCEDVRPYADTGNCYTKYGVDTGKQVTSLRYYSDHWATVASFY